MNLTLNKYFTCLILLAALPGFAQDQFDPTLPGAIVKTYKEVGDKPLVLNIFYPENRSESLPAVIFFFGGGWRNGSPVQFLHHCEYLASRGIIAISAEYRVKSRDNTTPFEAVADAKSAIRYLRNHAADLGIDPERIVAGGGSAGGHLAACTALIEGVNETGEDQNISSKPQLLILFNPALDLLELAKDRLGEKVVEISPMQHIALSAPPTLIFHGTADSVVPIDQVFRFRDKMHDFGNLCQVVAYKNQGHAFFNYGKSDHKYFKHTVYLMDRFLAAHGYLEGDPTIELLVVE